MNSCKYCRYEVVRGIEHTFCTNEALKELNKSNGKDIPCSRVGTATCGQFTLKNTDRQEMEEK